MCRTIHQPSVHCSFSTECELILFYVILSQHRLCLHSKSGVPSHEWFVGFSSVETKKNCQLGDSSCTVLVSLVSVLELWTEANMEFLHPLNSLKWNGCQMLAFVSYELCITTWFFVLACFNYTCFPTKFWMQDGRFFNFRWKNHPWLIVADLLITSTGLFYSIRNLLSL